MSYLEHSIPLILDSAQATTTNNDNSSFRVHFAPIIDVPREAVSAKIALKNAAIWYKFPNLLSSATHEFRFTITSTNTTTSSTVTGSAKAVSLEGGRRWSLADIQAAVNAFTEADPNCCDSLFLFERSSATGKVTITTEDAQSGSPTITMANVVIDWNHANMAGLAVLLGFSTSGTTGGTFAAGASVQTATGTSQATFDDDVTMIQVRSDLATGGIDPSGSSSTIVGTIVPNVEYNKRIVVELENVVWHELSIANGHFTDAWIHCCDQTGANLDMGGEHWQVTLLISYKVFQPEPDLHWSKSGGHNIVPQLQEAGYSRR